MKIGIITIHYSFITCNYGSLMQLYAMQQVLEVMSVQSALIKQLPKPLPVPPPPTARQKLNYYCRHPWNLLTRCARSLKPERKAPRPAPSFESFIEREIHSLSPIFLPGELNAQELDFDAYLAGSDQIWTSCEPEKLLDFAPSGKRIAYAASAAWGKQPRNGLLWLRGNSLNSPPFPYGKNTGWKYAGKPAQKKWKLFWTPHCSWTAGNTPG